MKQEINNIIQTDTECIYQAWKILCAMLRKRPHRGMLNPDILGSIMSKTTAEVIQLLNEISENAVQWLTNKIIIKKVGGVNQAEVLNSLTQQITALTQKFETFQVSSQSLPQLKNQSNIEDLLSKHLKATKDLIHKHIRATNEKVESHHSAIRNSEIQVSQIATLVSGQIQDALPGNTERILRNISKLSLYALTQLPSYAKFLKDILSSKRKLEEVSVVKLIEKYSVILQNKLPRKLGDLGSFTIPCTLGGVIEDVLVKVDKFIFFVDFIVLEMEENTEVPLILGRLFLATGRAIIDVHQGPLILQVDEERVIFDM
ncbi:hypothetical protein R3W88_007895 [Solanum pinnatisectum]|uniref:Uncharacterized protein n=1 Tax=Solanum pinnatisectum TaxID=50273 RepID=A0AAV9M8Z3_9SOLN|nr:hypothetical protein R3W88_007895 [Solanum pinnatisectum]